MFARTLPRTERLLRLWVALGALCLVLLAIMTEQWLADVFGWGSGVVIQHHETAQVQKSYAPTINWGGAKR